jgi:hypothetical protein
VATANDVPAAFANILRVLPLTKKVVVVSGASANEKVWMEEFRRELAPLSARITLAFFDELSFEDILKKAAALPPQSAIFWQTMNVDAAGVAHEANSALSRLAAAANAPKFWGRYRRWPNALGRRRKCGGRRCCPSHPQR